MRFRKLSIIAAAALAAAAPAMAGAPQPTRPVARSLYSGRWYEIAHTPNPRERDCQGATSDFATSAHGDLTVVETCHRGGPVGPARSFSAKAAILPGAGGAKFAMSFVGGLIHQQYWILDHAADWAIMATPGGNYVWLLSRRPVMDEASRALALGRVHALGYDTGRLVFPQQEKR
jgi:apolipoprotein D and lipocalin family protein